MRGWISAKFWREEEVFSDDIFTNLTWWLKDVSRHALSVNFAAVTKRTITLRWISQYLRTYLWKGWEGSLKIFHKRSPFRWVLFRCLRQDLFFFFFNFSLWNDFTLSFFAYLSHQWCALSISQVELTGNFVTVTSSLSTLQFVAL